MKKVRLGILGLIVLAGLSLLFNTGVMAANNVVIIPLGKALEEALGNAQPEDVLKGKTFSNSTAKGLVGTMVPHPISQTYFSSVVPFLQFNLLPEGKFMMGSPESEVGRSEREGPQSEITISRSFYMQITEVTQFHWQFVVLAAELQGLIGVDELDDIPSKYSGLLNPIENVSYEDVITWIDLLNKLENRTGCGDLHSPCYRLPTEAEWEYAARGGIDMSFPLGNAFYDENVTEWEFGFNHNLDAIGWYIWNNAYLDSNGNPEFRRNDGSPVYYPATPTIGVIGFPEGTKPVARKQPNAWGLYDMHGNVYEWCRDWYSRLYYSDPTRPKIDPEGPGISSTKVIRGGSFSSIGRWCRSAYRDFHKPSDSGSYLGFRLILPSE